MKLTDDQRISLRCQGCGGEMYDDFERPTYVLGCQTCNERRQKRERRAGQGKRVRPTSFALPVRQYMTRRHPVAMMSGEDMEW